MSMRREAKPGGGIEFVRLSYVANTMGTNPVALHDCLHQRSIYFALFCLNLL